MYQTGTDKSELVCSLKTIDGLTGVDRVLTGVDHVNGDRGTVFIKGMYDKRGRFCWVMSGKNTAYSSTGVYRERGKGYRSLAHQLNVMDEPHTAESGGSVIVLALARTSVYKNYDGTIDTFWFEVDPVMAGTNDTPKEFDTQKGVAKLEFDLTKIGLTEAEYKACTSKLALWDEEQKILYPIQPCATSSVGKILGCDVIFRHDVSAPLASAIILAERIAGTKNLRFLTRKRTEKVRPLIAFLGKRYSYISQLDFVREALGILQKNCIFHIENWIVSDEYTKIQIVIDNMNSLYQPIVEIHFSDISTPELCVSVFARFGKGRILLRRNNDYHCEAFKRRGVRSLFDGVFDAITTFDASIALHASDQVWYDPSMLKPFLKPLGETRFAAITKPKAGTYLLSSILYDVIDGMHVSGLNERWTMELAKCGTGFLNRIMGEKIVSLDKTSQLETSDQEVV